MTRDGMAHDEDEALSFEYELDAPPETVWRAVTVPEYLARWLPGARLAGPEDDEPRSDDQAVLRVVSTEPGREISFGWREARPPFPESVVTFRLTPNGTGGTTFRIIHAPRPASFAAMAMSAANDNPMPLKRAA